MTWLKKDDRYPEHRKIRRLSDGAYRLHDTALCWAAKDETDGFISDDDLDEMQHGRKLRKYVPELVRACLWEPVAGGWTIHDFLHYNPSHQQLEAERAAARDRQARHRARKKGVNTDESPDSNAVTNAVTNGDVTRESHPPVPYRTDPTRPDPTAPKGATSSAARKRAAHALPSGWEPNEGHILKAKELGVNLSRAVETFRNHALANDRRQVDWDRAFYNWLLKEKPSKVVPLRPAAGGLTDRQLNPWKYQ